MTSKDMWWSKPPETNEQKGNARRHRPGQGERAKDSATAQLRIEGGESALSPRSSRHQSPLRYTQRDLALLDAIYSFGGVLTTVQIAQKFWPPDVKRRLVGLRMDVESASEVIGAFGLARTNQTIELYLWLVEVAKLLRRAKPDRAHRNLVEWLQTLHAERLHEFSDLVAMAEHALASNAQEWIMQTIHSGRAEPTLFMGRPLLPSATVSSACKARLRALADDGVIEAWEQPVRLTDGRAQSCWFLTKRGRNLVAEMQGVHAKSLFYRPAGSYGTLHMSHRIGMNDVRIAIEVAAEQKGYSVTRWLDDQDLKRMLAKEKVLLRRRVRDERSGVMRDEDERHTLKIPDGYFVLDLGQGRERHCFLEYDNQTLTIAYNQASTKDFAHKIRTLAAFYRSGRYAQLFPEAGDSMWFLTVTSGSEKRLHNLKATTESVIGQGNRAADRYWFARKDDLPTWQEPFTAAAFTPIWRRAGQNKKWALGE